MTVLVTGGAGFIGAKLTRSLLARGEKVRVLDLETDCAAHLESQGAEVVRGDILSPKDVVAALNGCDRLFHVAALFRMWHLDPSRYHAVNVEGTRNVLDRALEKKVERVVHTSSAVTIGEAEGELGEEDTVHRGYLLSHYERSKCLGEQVAIERYEQGLPLVVVNPTSVYGPAQTSHLTDALARFLNGRLPAVIDVRMNFAYIDDVVSGHLAAMQKGQVGERYILGGHNASLSEFLSLAAKIAGVQRKPRQVPAWLMMAAARMLHLVSLATKRRPWVSLDEARTASHSFVFDTRRAQEELGLEWTPLRTGLESTVSWLRQEGLAGGSAT
jgi:nucleoside-diphosphate-sugar epimerase